MMFLLKSDFDDILGAVSKKSDSTSVFFTEKETKIVHFHSDFSPLFRPQTTTSYSQTLTFALTTTIRHQNCTLNMVGFERTLRMGIIVLFP